MRALQATAESLHDDYLGQSVDGYLALQAANESHPAMDSVVDKSRRAPVEDDPPRPLADIICSANRRILRSSERSLVNVRVGRQRSKMRSSSARALEALTE
jgi:hypothetical protein